MSNAGNLAILVSKWTGVRPAGGNRLKFYYIIAIAAMVFAALAATKKVNTVRTVLVYTFFLAAVYLKFFDMDLKNDLVTFVVSGVCLAALGAVLLAAQRARNTAYFVFNLPPARVDDVRQILSGAMPMAREGSEPSATIEPFWFFHRLVFHNVDRDGVTAYSREINAYIAANGSIHIPTAALLFVLAAALCALTLI